MSSIGPGVVASLHSTSITMFAAVFFTFIAAFFLVLAYMDVLRRRGDIRRRAVLDRNMGAQGTLESGWFNSPSSLRYQSLSVTSSLLGDVERRGKEKETESSKIRRELSKAGYFGENSVIWYQSIRLSLLGSF
ncbi:MAG: hypothetical protein WBX25_12035, partial [Rhodomicrobium sp.]